MPIEKRVPVDATPLEHHVSLSATYAGHDCIVERKYRIAESSWVPVPPLLVRAAPADLALSFPVPEDAVGRPLTLWVQVRLAVPDEQTYTTGPVAVPRDAFLRGGIGVDRIGESDASAPVDFRLVARTARGEVVLLERQLDGARTGWNDFRVDLATLAGETVRFVFTSRARPVPGAGVDQFSFPLWGSPEVLAPVKGSRRPNVVLVSLDTLRGDHVGAYGCDLPTTPVLDHLATEGTLFERAMTTYPSTTVAHMSMLTGLYPAGHGVTGPLTALHPTIPTLAELFYAQGYATAAVTEDGMISPGSGFARGFAQYREFKGESEVKTFGHVAEVVDAGLAWITDHHDAPFFVFLHTYQVHGPYTPPPEFDLFKTYRVDGQERTIGPDTPEEIRERYAYAGEVRYTDSEIGRLVDGLARLGEADRTVLVVTADHGESFRYRDGLLGHGWNVYEDVLRIPLIVRAPGLVPAGRRVRPPVSLVDIVPTVLELAGVPVPASVEGRSLVPLFRTDDAPGFADRPLFAEVRIRDTHLIAVRQGSRKWIMEADGHAGRVYEPDRDPTEQHDLATPESLAEGRAHLARYDGLRDQLARRVGVSRPGAATPDERTTDKLKALGYVH